MDNGEVIPGLNEDWTLGGAKLGEWISGFMMFLVASELIFNPVGQHMPQLMITWVTTTFGMAALRRSFPDEERGLRNTIMTELGINPTGIPTPATLQPYWSGAPMRGMDQMKEFMTLGLKDIFPEEEEVEDTDARS